MDRATDTGSSKGIDFATAQQATPECRTACIHSLASQGQARGSSEGARATVVVSHAGCRGNGVAFPSRGIGVVELDLRGPVESVDCDVSFEQSSGGGNEEEENTYIPYMVGSEQHQKVALT